MTYIYIKFNHREDHRYGLVSAYISFSIVTCLQWVSDLVEVKYQSGEHGAKGVHSNNAFVITAVPSLTANYWNTMKWWGGAHVEISSTGWHVTNPN